MDILQPRVVIGVAVIVVIFLFVSLAQEMNRRWQIQREVQRLEQEVAGMQKSVIELENLNQYFRTDAYQERLAREKLGYQAPGEKVVLIPEESAQEIEREATPASEKPVSIPEQWWRAFFVEPQQRS